MIPLYVFYIVVSVEVIDIFHLVLYLKAGNCTSLLQ